MQILERSILQRYSISQINEKLEKNPNDSFLKYKKGLVFELMKQYDSAYFYQSFREITDPYEKNQWNQTLEILRAAKLKNKLAATYTKASSDSLPFSASLASLSYNHKYDEKNINHNVQFVNQISYLTIQG